MAKRKRQVPSEISLRLKDIARHVQHVYRRGNLSQAIHRELEKAFLWGLEEGLKGDDLQEEFEHSGELDIEYLPDASRDALLEIARAHIDGLPDKIVGLRREPDGEDGATAKPWYAVFCDKEAITGRTRKSRWSGRTIDPIRTGGFFERINIVGKNGKRVSGPDNYMLALTWDALFACAQIIDDEEGTELHDIVAAACSRDHPGDHEDADDDDDRSPFDDRRRATHRPATSGLGWSDVRPAAQPTLIKLVEDDIEAREHGNRLALRFHDQPGARFWERIVVKSNGKIVKHPNRARLHINILNHLGAELKLVERIDGRIEDWLNNRPFTDRWKPQDPMMVALTVLTICFVCRQDFPGHDDLVHRLKRLSHLRVDQSAQEEPAAGERRRLSELVDRAIESVCEKAPASYEQLMERGWNSISSDCRLSLNALAYSYVSARDDGNRSILVLTDHAIGRPYWHQVEMTPDGKLHWDCKLMLEPEKVSALAELGVFAEMHVHDGRPHFPGHLDVLAPSFAAARFAAAFSNYDHGEYMRKRLGEFEKDPVDEIWMPIDAPERYFGPEA